MGSIALVALLMSACSADETAACAAQARVSTPPSARDAATLDAIAARISRDNGGRPDIWFIYSDRAAGLVSIGVMNRTPAVCEELHARYGPLLEIEGPPRR